MMIVRADTDWRSGLPARLVAAAVVGALTGAILLLVGHVVPLRPVSVGCKPAGSFGCDVFGPIGGILIGAMVWLLTVIVSGLVVGGLCTWLVGRFARIPLGAVTGVAWPVTLWVVATLLRPLGVRVELSSAGAVGWIALAFVVAAGLTAPQLRLAVRLTVAGLIVVGVVVAHYLVTMSAIASIP